MTRRTPFGELRARLKGRTQREVAKELGVNEAVLSSVLAGARAMPDNLLEALGFERAVVYRPKRNQEATP